MSYCTRCLREVGLAEFLANDHICDDCAALPLDEHFGWRSTPDQIEALEQLQEKR